MVLLTYSPEILEKCITKILSRSSWKRESAYLRSSFCPLRYVDIKDHTYTLGNVAGSFYLRNSRAEYCKIHTYMYESLCGQNRFTFWLGPYAFLNNFEETREGKYLIKMLEHIRLSTAAQRKVDEILSTYAFWVQTDKQMLDILKRVRSVCAYK